MAAVLGGWGCAGGLLSRIGVTGWGCSGRVGVSCHSGVSGCGVLGGAGMSYCCGRADSGALDVLGCLGFVACPAVVG